MSYPHFQITVPLLSTAGDPTLTANSTGDKGHWGAGPNQYIVRRVGIQKTATTVWGAGGGSFSFREASGTAATATGNEFARISTTSGTSAALAKSGLRYNDDFTPRKIRPGNRIVVAVRTAATGSLFRAFAVIEPSTEHLPNLGTGTYLSVTA
jgi:hypothetical protein